ILELQLLQSDHVRLPLLQPVEDKIHPRTKTIDVPSSEPHSPPLQHFATARRGPRYNSASAFGLGALHHEATKFPCPILNRPDRPKRLRRSARRQRRQVAPFSQVGDLLQ